MMISLKIESFWVVLINVCEDLVSLMELSAILVHEMAALVKFLVSFHM